MVRRWITLSALRRREFERLLKLLILRLATRRHELLCGLMMYHRDSLMIMKWLSDLVCYTVVISTWDGLHTLAHLCTCIWRDNHWSVFICTSMHTQVSTVSIRRRLSSSRLSARSITRRYCHSRSGLWMKFVLTKHRLVVIILARQCLHSPSYLSCISMSFLLADEFLSWWGARIDRRDLFISRLYADICTWSCYCASMNTCATLTLFNSRLAPRITPRCRSRICLRNTLVLVLDLRLGCLSLLRLLRRWLLWSSCTFMYIVGWLTVLAF